MAAICEVFRPLRFAIRARIGLRSSGEWRNSFPAYCGADRSHPIAYHRSRSRAFRPGSDCGSRNTLSPQGRAPGSVFALYVPNRQTLSRLSRARALVFYFLFTSPTMAAFSMAAPANPPTRQTECLSPHQVRVCDLPSARQWIRQRDADRRGVVALPPKGDSYALRHEQRERPVVLHRHGLTVTTRGLAEAEPRR
jgi:hypothetical protein